MRSKRTFNLFPNYTLSIIFFVLGILVVIFDIFDIFPGLNFLFNPGTAIAIFLAVIPLFIKEFNTYSSWKTENLLRYTILDLLMFEQIDAMRNIRYKQRIEFTIDPFEHKQGESFDKFLKITCVHKYTYKNESLVKKNINIDIFNDIFIPASKIQKDNPYQRTDFNWVELLYKNGKNKTYERKKNPEYFEILPDGRPHFQKNISLDARDEVTLTYSIRNEFELFSRLVWNIQELSENVEILVINKSPYDLSKFILAINHPNRKEMHKANEKNLNDKCCLKKEVSDTSIIRRAKNMFGFKKETSDGNFDCKILFDHPFLPYQGFELKWDLQ